MNTDQDVYLVEDIVQLYDENDKKKGIYSLVLSKALESDQSKNDENVQNYGFIISEVNKEQVRKLKAGQFVFFNSSIYGSAYRTRVAQQNILNNKNLRGLLLANSSEYEQETTGYEQGANLFENASIYSYHINVGHGNCSIIVIKNMDEIKLWMIDCSNYDYKIGFDYQPNIDFCLNHIKNKFELNDLKIDKFFLTHPHFDHYSGINYLIDNNNIDSNTTFFINLYYSMPSVKYNKLLSKITTLGSKIIEPISTFQKNGIDIWHPLVRTFRTRPSNVIRLQQQGPKSFNVETKPNNSSAVYHLKFGNRSILFPET